MPIKLLLNNKEIANFLNSKIDLVEHLKKFEQNMAHTAETIMWIRESITKKGLENLDIIFLESLIGLQRRQIR